MVSTSGRVEATVAAAVTAAAVSVQSGLSRAREISRTSGAVTAAAVSVAYPDRGMMSRKNVRGTQMGSDMITRNANGEQVFCVEYVFDVGGCAPASKKLSFNA